MLLRLAILAAIVLVVWAACWALRRYAANGRPAPLFDLADAAEAGAAPLLVTFSGPYCSSCQEILPRLKAASSEHRVALRVIDIKANPELAAKYDVRLTPTTLVVDPGGRVAAGWLGTPPEGAVEEALSALVATR